MEIRFSIPGDPKGKQRPRVVRTNGFSRTYTPEQTLNYENMVKWCYKQANGTMFSGAVSVSIIAYYGIPKSVSKKKRQQMIDTQIRPTKKPDLDNLAKLICDALNGIAYHDDSAVVDLRVRKYYSETPCVNVVILDAPDESIPFSIGGLYGE